MEKRARMAGALRWARRSAIVAVLFPLLARADAPAPPAEEPPERRLILVANADDPDSLAVARHYAEKRGVPAENLVALPLSKEETISRRDFSHTLWNPLLEELVRRGWIDALLYDNRDAAGRRRAGGRGHRLSYLVLSRGVPLRIEPDEAFAQAEQTRRLPRHLRGTQATVDSELALLASSTPFLPGPLANPLHRERRPDAPAQRQIVKVARLDGPTRQAAQALVESALAAERQGGLSGRAYVDLGGPFAEGDRWLEATARVLTDAGFAVEIDPPGRRFDGAARLEAAAVYAGWYSENVDGPFVADGFGFPPGAIALHLHSFSARTLRSATEGWAGPLVARGAAATVGNSYEPYLNTTHRFDLMIEFLLDGATWGEATAYGLPVLSWQSVAIGDPLYRPFPRRAHAPSLSASP